MMMISSGVQGNPRCSVIKNGFQERILKNPQEGSGWEMSPRHPMPRAVMAAGFLGFPECSTSAAGSAVKSAERLQKVGGTSKVPQTSFPNWIRIFEFSAK
jgi:hypothetical protein